MTNDRRETARDSDRRSTPRYNIASLSATIGPARLDVQVNDIGEDNIKLKSTDQSLKLGDSIKLSLSVPLLDQIVTIPINGNVSRTSNDQVVVSYDQPVQTWQRILPTLERVCA